MLSRIASARTLVVLAHIAALAFLVWAAWSAAQRLPYFADQSREQTPAAVASVETPRSSAVPVDTVAAAHLFGTKPADSAQPSAVNAPETRLKLTLTGVFASSREKIAHAIIEVEAQPPKSYGVGDSIEQTDAKLHSVEANRVLLDRNGQLEALLMVRTGLGGDARPGPADALNVPELSPESDPQGARLQELRRALQTRGTKTF